MLTRFRRHATPEGLDQELAKRLPEVIEQSGDIIFITNRQGRIEYVNAAFEQLTGYRRDEVRGLSPNVLKSGEHDPVFYDKLWQEVTAGRRFEAVFTNRRKDGSLFYEQKTISPLFDRGGHITHFVSSGKDITAQLQSRLQLLNLSRRHPVSGLPNRNLLRERLERVAARAERGGHLGALVLLDLDGFAAVNAEHGHDLGDHLLIAAAGRLRGQVRETDSICHLGADRFAVIVEELATIDHIEAVARKFMNVLGEPYELLEETVKLGCSAGVVVLPFEEGDPVHILRHAERALASAKAGGRSQMRLFHADMATLRSEEQRLLDDLGHALERREFRLHFQPILELAGRRVVGVEALLRWERGGESLLPPAAFIGELERMGEIVPVTSWVLRQAARQVRILSETLGRDLYVSVNLSGGCLQHAGLCDAIHTLLHEHILSPRQLQLELTEQALLENLELADGVLRTLKNAGVMISLDDFGTGYSSLTYLERFGFDRVKIDRDFVRGLGTHTGDARLVRAIIGMAHGMDMQVTAEGVETEAQAALLLEAGCDHAQGFLFYRPRPYGELVRELS